jgi:Zn finger protein HypA/HybF involved in hydrogenase expression
MQIKPLCLNCETELVHIKGGYHCPNCHSLFTIDMKIIWDATKKHRNPGAATMH